MATLDTPMVERRQLPDRRANTDRPGLTGVDWVPLALLILGGLNWGLIGLMNIDVVAMIFGEGPGARLIYLAVGLSALYGIYMAFHLGQRKTAAKQP